MKSVSMCFSPTGGGEKIAKAIRRGMDGNLDEGMEPYLFVIPVYGGHMPVPARECFEKVCVTDNRPAILAAVYGNRAFERALVDLEDFVCERGFCPIAAAAFVCEHSYSTADTPRKISGVAELPSARRSDAKKLYRNVALMPQKITHR